MTDNLAGKSVPWDSIQKYIAALKQADADAAEFISLKNKGLLPVAVVETTIPSSMLLLYILLNQILNDNNIINEKEQERNKIEIIISTVLKLSNTIVGQNALN